MDEDNYPKSFAGRKAYRTNHYEQFIKGWRLRPCVACAGTGRSDTTGSPRCGACQGTGRERYKALDTV